MECARSHHRKTRFETLVFTHANIAELQFRKLCGTHLVLENLTDPATHVSCRIQMLQVFEEHSDNYICASLQLVSRKVIPLQSITQFKAIAETSSSIISEFHDRVGFNSHTSLRDRRGGTICTEICLLFDCIALASFSRPSRFTSCLLLSAIEEPNVAKF